MQVDFKFKLSLSSFDLLKHQADPSRVLTVHDWAYLNLISEYTSYFHKRELQSKFGGNNSPPNWLLTRKGCGYQSGTSEANTEVQLCLSFYFYSIFYFLFLILVVLNPICWQLFFLGSILFLSSGLYCNLLLLRLDKVRMSGKKL